MTESGRCASPSSARSCGQRSATWRRGSTTSARRPFPASPQSQCSTCRSRSARSTLSRRSRSRWSRSATSIVPTTPSGRSATSASRTAVREHISTSGVSAASLSSSPSFSATTCGPRLKSRPNTRRLRSASRRAFAMTAAPRRRRRSPSSGRQSDRPTNGLSTSAGSRRRAMRDRATQATRSGPRRTRAAAVERSRHSGAY